MTERILVINPNSTQAVTDAMNAACEPLRIAGGPAIECMTLAEGPPGVETQRDADGVIVPLVRAVSQRERDYAAFVIACFSDPGLHAVREVTTKPVLGIAECGILTALTLGSRFGVIAILRQSIARHQRYIAALGVVSRLAGELALGIGVTGLADEKRTYAAMVETGTRLRDAHGADVVVMGCAGMAQYRDRLQDALKIPVVEPTQSAVAMAIGRVRLGWHVERKHRSC